MNLSGLVFSGWRHPWDPRGLEQQQPKTSLPFSYAQICRTPWNCSAGRKNTQSDNVPCSHLRILGTVIFLRKGQKNLPIMARYEGCLGLKGLKYVRRQFKGGLTEEGRSLFEKSVWPWHWGLEVFISKTPLSSVVLRETSRTHVPQISVIQSPLCGTTKVNCLLCPKGE
jgi:hypothetical protein